MVCRRGKCVFLENEICFAFLHILRNYLQNVVEAIDINTNTIFYYIGLSKLKYALDFYVNKFPFMLHYYKP